MPIDSTRSRKADRRVGIRSRPPGLIGLGPLILGVLFTLMTWPAVWAAQVQVEAVVDRNQVRMSESIRLQVIISGADGQVDTSKITDFEVVSRGTSTNIRIVNGRASKSLTYNFTLLPRREGRLEIPPLPVRIQNTAYRTRPIVILVSDQQADLNAGADVILKARVTAHNPFQGQQLLYTLTVYHSESLRNVQLQKPSFEGFTVNSIEEQRTGSTMINGRPYRSIQLAYALIPIEAGPIVIEPSVLRCDIVRPPRGAPRSMFDSFFDNDPFLGRGRLEPRVLRSDELTVNVRPLPPYTGEGEFSGLVGQFDIRTDLDLSELNSGESTTFSVTISGKGNIVDAVMPTVYLPQQFKQYRDDPEEAIKLGPGGFAGKKVFRIALVPMQAGDYTIEPIRWSYFDIPAGRYRDLSTKALHLKVLPTDQADNMVVYQSPPASELSLKKQVEFTGRDILPLKDDLDVLENDRLLSPVGFTGLLLAPALLYGLVILSLNLSRKRQDPTSIMLARSRRALKKAQTSVSDPPTCLAFLHKALSAAVLARAGTRATSLTYAEAESILRKAASDATLAQETVDLLKTIDSARYSGSLPQTDAPQRFIDDTRQVIKKLI